MAEDVQVATAREESENRDLESGGGESGEGSVQNLRPTARPSGPSPGSATSQWCDPRQPHRACLPARLLRAVTATVHEKAPQRPARHREGTQYPAALLIRARPSRSWSSCYWNQWPALGYPHPDAIASPLTWLASGTVGRGLGAVHFNTLDRGIRQSPSGKTLQGIRREQGKANETWKKKV